MGEYIGIDWQTVLVKNLYFVAPWRCVCIAGHGVLVYESILTVRRIER